MTDLEEIAERLKFVMSLQGFKDIQKRPREFQRYEKSGSSIGFVVGIEYDTKLKDRYVDFVCSYDVPDYVDAEQMFPDLIHMGRLLHHMGFEYFHERSEELHVEGKSVTMDCELKVNPNIDGSILVTAASSLIDYICDTVTRNVDMMKKVHSMKEMLE